ncbi:hypothetical protein D3C84_929260 [compost metagenome]
MNAIACVPPWVVRLALRWAMFFLTVSEIEVVALPLTKAPYSALTIASRVLVWLRKLLSAVIA